MSFIKRYMRLEQLSCWKADYMYDVTLFALTGPLVVPVAMWVLNREEADRPALSGDRHDALLRHRPAVLGRQAVLLERRRDSLSRRRRDHRPRQPAAFQFAAKKRRSELN